MIISEWITNKRKEKGNAEMNDIEKKMEALKAEFLGKLEALQREAEMQKKQEEPKLGEKYFYISQFGRAILDTFTQHPTDFARKNLGNFFSTEARAEQVAEKIRLLLRLERLHDMLCPDYVPDYEDEDEVKYHVYFNHLQGKYNISCSTSRENPCMVAFDTKESIEKTAEILNKELEESK